jgi:hypothetical protein
MWNPRSLSRQWNQLQIAGKTSFILKFGVLRFGLIVTLAWLIADAIHLGQIPSMYSFISLVSIGTSVGILWAFIVWDMLERMNSVSRVNGVGTTSKR